MRHLAALILVLSTGSLSAQVFMRPFDNAAQMGMGGAATAWHNTEHGLANPAQLSQPQKIQLLAWSAIPYGLTDWRSGGAQANFRINDKSGAGIDLVHSGIEGYSEQRIQGHYGRRLGAKFALGGTLQAMRVSANEYGNQQAISFSVGVLAQPLKKVYIGAVVYNPIPQRLGDAQLASGLRIGAAWQPSELFTVVADVDKDIERRAIVRAGVEYRPTTTVFLRAGTRTGASRMTFGGGFRFKNGIALDFGSEWHNQLGFTPSVMLSWQR
jgi:hypothetical protein